MLIRLALEVNPLFNTMSYFIGDYVTEMQYLMILNPYLQWLSIVIHLPGKPSVKTFIREFHFQYNFHLLIRWIKLRKLAYLKKSD